MDLFQVALLVSVMIGVLLIVFALFIFSSESGNERQGHFGDAGADKIPDASIDEMDKAMDELSAASRAVFSEMDEKYQELLFLYSLIDDKNNETANLYGNKATRDDASKHDRHTASKPIENPRLKDILRLKNQGLAVPEIAKQLDMGQGEVKLILELGKMR